MRLLPIVAAALVAIPSIGHTQKQFEGEVTLSLHKEGRVQNMDAFIKGQRMRMNMAAGNGQTMGMIADYGASRVIVLMPQMKMYMNQTIQAAEVGSADARVTRTGKTETIAGHRCEVMRIEDDEGRTVNVCAATDMGTFVMGGPGRGRAPAWARGMKGFFPLRVSDEKGVTVLEVTRIEEKKVDEALFTPPADFKAMSVPGR